jgi:hypothetical protein
MFFFITVTEVYLVVPGYQIHMVSIHQKSWLVYQHVFRYYSDGSLPCSARLPDTSDISTPEELTALPTCFFFITVTEVYLVVPGYQIHMVSIHQKSWLVYQHVFLYYSDGSLPCSARLPDTSGISTPEELTGLPTCFSLLQWRSLPCSARLPDTSGISTPEELNDLITCFNPQCLKKQNKRYI